MIIIKLTASEMLMAATSGVVRHQVACKAGLSDRFGAGEDGLLLHIAGAAGEIAFAKHKGIYFGGISGSFKGPDFGDNIQVRTRTLHKYELIIRDDDNLKHTFFLMTGCGPEIHLHGGILGRDARKPEYGGRASAWFVPHSALKDM